MKKWINAFVFSVLLVFSASAHEGMWLPILLDIDDMQRNGLKLSAEDIYSVNEGSLKDAIVHFGGGCTSEMISDQGLLLTNHHCGYGNIQRLSSLENDYLKDGFWASNMSEELACAGLTATFVVKIVDVTDSVLIGVTEGMSWEERQAIVAERSNALKAVHASGAFIDAEIKPFYYGNQYIMIVTKTYEDVRLVGTPPSSIGKFGGDTDNWVWPRHTGDFALFRIYADENNEPVAYSENNKPYQPARSLEISIDGVKEGDFTMVYGFPGRTDQYMVSDGVEFVTEQSNPVRIEMREKSLEVIDAAMASSDALRIQYASRQSMISNAYKKWIGQNMGLNRFNAVEKKREQEAQFRKAAESTGQTEYSDALTSLQELHREIAPYQMARDMLVEFVFYGPELLNFTRRTNALIAAIEAGEDDNEISALREKAVRAVDNHYKDYDVDTDKKVFENTIGIYAGAVQSDLQAPALSIYTEKYKADAASYANYIYSKSVFLDREKLTKVLKDGSAKKILKLKSDPAYLLTASIFDHFVNVVRPSHESFSTQIEEKMQVYMKGLMTLNPDKIYWSEANSTIRVTYGKVEGCIPRDGLSYLPTTTLEGVVHKYVPGDRDFDVPGKLLELYESTDYGPYGTDDGELNVCFLASNHTTGGNSGSPVLNADGQLIGLNFDRSWESTMSDLMFNPEICRNISVDVRYILFVVDRFAGAKWLIDEMNIVKN